MNGYKVRLLGIADLHGEQAALARILADAGPVDAVLLGGDLTQFGTPEAAAALVEQAREPGVPVLAVAGNCDSAAIDQRLEELGVGLHGRGVIVQGVGIHGLSGIPPWRSSMYQFSEEELADALRRGHEQIAGADCRVLLAHVPPHGCRCDRTMFFHHIGSTAVRQFVETAQPALVLCGHVHEAAHLDELGETLVVNCGAAKSGHYAIVELSDRVRVEQRRA